MIEKEFEQIAKTQFHNKQFQKCIQTCYKCISINPALQWTYDLLGYSYMNLSMHSQSKGCFAVAKTLGSNEQKVINYDKLLELLTDKEKQYRIDKRLTPEKSNNPSSKIAINLITKNDEPRLEKALESAKDLNPEYIIIYTGDIKAKEYEICRWYDPKCTYTEWKDHFSEIRNLAIERTTADWIIWLYSDEEIEQSSIPKILEIAKTSSNPYHKFELIHSSIKMKQMRMFHKSGNKKWEFAVHERIVPTTLPENHSDIHIIHNIQNVQKSSARNINIINRELEKDPSNFDYHFYAAVEYHLINQQMKALSHAEKFLFNYTTKNNDVKKMYMRYLKAWICAFHLNNQQKSAEIAFGQLVHNCNIAEFWSLLGDIYLNLGKFDHAYRLFENAIIMGQYKYDGLWATDLDKYDKYPKIKMEYCKTKAGVDYTQFETEINTAIIP